MGRARSSRQKQGAPALDIRDAARTGRSPEALDIRDGAMKGRSPEALDIRDAAMKGRSPEALDIRDAAEGTTFRVRVQPRASREAFGGEREGALVVRLRAPPVEGAANRALTRLLARVLGVAPSAVAIVSGGGGRNKRVAVAGIDAETARHRLGTRMED